MKNKNSGSAANKNPGSAAPPVMAGRMEEYVRRKKRRTLWRLLKNFWRHKALTGAALFLAALTSFTVIVKPYILRYVIDKNLEIGKNDLEAIGFLAILYFAVVSIGAAGDYLQTLTLGTLGQRIMHRMRAGLFAHIQSMNMSFFDKNSSGSLLTRVNSDVESLSSLFSDVVITMIKDMLLILQIMGAMLLLDREIALYCFICVPVVAALTIIYRSLARRNFIKMKAQLSRLNGFLAENITGMKIVQIYRREKAKFAEFAGLGRQYYRIGLTEIMLNSLSNPLLTAISHFCVAILLSAFAPSVIGGRLDIGVLYAFTLYIRQFFGPISHLADQFTSIQSSLISADRIYDILDKTDTFEDVDAGLPFPEFSGHIEFKNVWFAYNGENWVIEDLSLEILPGQSVAFVGATGSGKSTIISLLARFYEIQKGEILLDGVNIKEYRLKDLRRRVSVVQQDVFLFTGDISYNIRLNDKDITAADIRRAARTVGAEEFINSLPEKYNAHVAERGMEFSAGQRQLISFARAVAADPAVLVLDEATSSIDTETELVLSRAMAAVSAEKTTITIAHRLSTIIHCDRIFVLDHGVLTEQGTHDELLALSGQYAALYKLSLARAKKDKGRIKV